MVFVRGASGALCDLLRFCCFARDMVVHEGSSEGVAEVSIVKNFQITIKVTVITVSKCVLYAFYI